MYKDYYGFQGEPFKATPDVRFLYMTQQHREALNHLLYGIRQRKGFICLTGEIGTGKTTLCRALLRELDDRFETALILNPLLTEAQLLRAVVEEFGIECKRQDRLGYLKLLNEFLLKVHAEGRDAVLIVDEAQDMPTATLEMTRLLSNLETESDKLLQIVLVGQPELRERLAKPALRQLAQRLMVRYHLEPMSRDDTDRYVKHRLEVAGGTIIRLDDDALREIYRFTRGTPRLVNALGDKVLLAGYVNHTALIDRRLVRLAAADLKEAG